MPTTLRNTDILFNDGTTQSTAGGIPSAFNAIGSIVIANNFSTSSFFPGNTIAGSSLLYITGFAITPTGSATGNADSYLEGSTTNFFTQVLYNMGGASNGAINGRRIGNLGAFQPSNTATLPGTWRVLTGVRLRNTFYEGYNNYTQILYWPVLVQRIS